METIETILNIILAVILLFGGYTVAKILIRADKVYKDVELIKKQLHLPEPEQIKPYEAIRELINWILQKLHIRKQN
jgi:hypothetical protein